MCLMVELVQCQLVLGMEGAEDTSLAKLGYTTTRAELGTKKGRNSGAYQSF